MSSCPLDPEAGIGSQADSGPRMETHGSRKIKEVALFDFFCDEDNRPAHVSLCIMTVLDTE